jgi:hypothetical protein
MFQSLTVNKSREQLPQQRNTPVLQQTNHNNSNTSGLFSQIRNNVQLSAASEPGEVLLAELFSDSGFQSSSGKSLYKISKQITHCLLVLPNTNNMKYHHLTFLLVPNTSHLHNLIFPPKFFIPFLYNFQSTVVL